MDFLKCGTRSINIDHHTADVAPKAVFAIPLQYLIHIYTVHQSTTYSGSLEAVIDEAPLTLTVAVAPGCPSDVISTPATLPSNIVEMFEPPVTCSSSSSVSLRTSSLNPQLLRFSFLLTLACPPSNGTLPGCFVL